MMGAIRAEFRKFFSTRLWWGMAIAILIVSALFAALFGWVYTLEGAAEGRDATATANSVYTGGLTVVYLLTLAIGVMQIGSEYRHKTITSTFLATPKRITVMGAKVISLLGIGAFYGVVSLIGSVVAGGLVLASRGAEVFPSAEVGRTLLLSLLVLGLWALIGLGVGILIPNQVAALLIAIGVAWIVEPVAASILSFWDWGADVAKFFPSQATQAIVDGVGASAMGGPGGDSLEWWAGAIVLAVYAIVLAGLGSFLTVKKDIS